MRRSSPAYHFIAHRRASWRCALALLLLLAGGEILPAQEQIRPSEVGEAAAELRERAPTITDYNLEIGPVLLKATGGLSLQFNDNINLSEKSRQADLIVNPNLTVNLTWPVTKTNVLTLSTAVGFQEYIFHPRMASTQVTVAPNSQLSFDIYTGDVRINLHDQFSVTDDPVNESELSNVTTYTQYTNTVGVGVLWDLAAAILTVDLDFTNVIAPGAEGDNSNVPDNTHTTASASFSALFPLTAITNVGANASYAYTSYAQASRGTATTISLGPFVQTRLTRYTQLNVSGGYQGVYFRQGGGSVGSQVPTGSGGASYFADISLTHQLNRFYSDSLSFGRQSQLGLLSGQEQYYFLEYSSQWSFTRRLGLGTSLSLQDVNEAVIGAADHYDQIVLNLGTGYALTRKLSASLGYQFTLKLANVANQGYIQDSLTIQFAYSF